MLVTRPTGLTFADWSSQMVLDLEKIGLIPIPPKEEDWQDWAVRVIGLSRLTQRNAPMPFGFTDWQDWAERFIQGVE